MSLVFVCSCATGIGRDPDRAALHLKIGTALLAQGQYPAALSELLAAEKLDPSNPVIQNNLGLAYLVRNHLEKAEEHVRKALSLNSKYTDARNNLGRILIEQKKLNEAVKELRIASQDLTYPEPHRPLTNLGEALFRSKQYKEAESILLKSLEYQRQECITIALYGRSLFEQKKYEAASSSLDEAIRTCTGSNKEEPYFFSALSYFRLGQKHQAHARAKECLEAFPKGRYATRIENLIRSIQ